MPNEEVHGPNDLPTEPTNDDAKENGRWIEDDVPVRSKFIRLQLVDVGERYIEGGPYSGGL